MGVVLYRIHGRPGEYDGDGENHDEWFSSLKAAKLRRAELEHDAKAVLSVDPNAFKFAEDFEVERVYFRGLPPQALLLAVLNRRGYELKRELVVPPAKLR